ncbi:galactokinase [Sporothrix schenckii 1099-18]|uniref:Galactokinase n=2 Tax=Sporothrix schenckii TaxID=29908 RepID=U7PJW7_SPOS1|nr:galactokinase [Sporothrix schenckii 1099-18]ERS95226.1 galactokinase [Sporothrix schenckii ATCC 58251]KJR90025.1 galactokinase [Sporothrix schenckii 1099-18]
MTTVPVIDRLGQIYTEDAVPAQTTRWQHLLATFRERHGREAAFVARSPGRVNVIGEHIDYSLYSVLPMAITGDCIIAVGMSEDKNKDSSERSEDTTWTVEISNVLPKFAAQTFTFAADDEVAIDASVHEWTNYFKSGLRGALALLRTKRAAAGLPPLRPRSLQVVLDGTVPVGGGLSSSAAFTSCSALAVLAANDDDNKKNIDKTALTELAIVSERSVGVNSGGMDQAASVFAERGAALFVSFAPTLTARPVFFPAAASPDTELCFLIAQSFVAADKFVTGPIHYNLRVVECTLAAAVLNARLNPPGTRLPGDSAPLGISLHGFHETYFALQEQGGVPNTPRSPKAQLQALVALVDKHLASEQGYTREEIASTLGVTVASLETDYMSTFPVRAERFKLRQRALHVFSEALRVLDFMEVLEAARGAAGHGIVDASTAATLGALLNATQDSCRDLYECSCPELDDLCAIARRAGSLGSRVTGAGWGGCSVHLVPANKVDAVRKAWDDEYYSKRPELTDEQRAAAVVLSRPGSGSAIYVGRGVN